jgi:Gly-Xaa carboxypeptidase
MRSFAVLSLLTVASAHVAQHRFSNALPSYVKQPGTYPRCDLPRPVDPSHDGLANAQEIFSLEKAILPMTNRLQSIVQVPTVVYNDMGDVDKDKRWKPFGRVAGALNKSYPNM